LDGQTDGILIARPRLHFIMVTSKKVTSMHNSIHSTRVTLPAACLLNNHACCRRPL